MHTTNVRELKKNPSRALRLAKDGPALILKGHEPDTLSLKGDHEVAISYDSVMSYAIPEAAQVLSDSDCNTPHAGRVGGQA